MGFPRQEYWGGLSFPSPGDCATWEALFYVDLLSNQIKYCKRRWCWAESQGKNTGGQISLSTWRKSWARVGLWKANGLTQNSVSHHWQYTSRCWRTECWRGREIAWIWISVLPLWALGPKSVSSLWPSLLIIKWYLPHRVIIRIKWVSTCKTLRIVPVHVVITTSMLSVVMVMMIVMVKVVGMVVAATVVMMMMVTMMISGWILCLLRKF